VTLKSSFNTIFMLTEWHQRSLKLSERLGRLTSGLPADWSSRVGAMKRP